jgi:hypothetical protein
MNGQAGANTWQPTASYLLRNLVHEAEESHAPWMSTIWVCNFVAPIWAQLTPSKVVRKCWRLLVVMSAQQLPASGSMRVRRQAPCRLLQPGSASDALELTMS